MNGDTGLDLPLRDRLSSLAAAAPVKSMPALATVPVVRVRRRPVALASLAPILALVVVGTVAANLAHIGPFATGSSQPNGAVSATTRSGDFVLQIDSAKARYGAGEQISVGAGLTYRGSASSVVVGHAGSGPIAFGIVEPINGLVLEPFWRLSCSTRSLDRGVPVEKPFGKSGGFDGADPSAAGYASFFTDEQLRLPVGTWHVYAIAQFSIGDCGSHPIEMRAEITIQVADQAALATSNPPSLEVTSDGTNHPTQPDGRVLDVVDTDGTFELRLHSAEAVYREGAPIELSTSFRYVGAEPAVSAAFFAPEVAFSIEQLEAEPINSRSTVYDSACVEITIKVDEPRRAELEKANIVLISAAQPDAWFDQLLSDGRLRLPAGRWRIAAEPSVWIGSCEHRGDRHKVRATFDITVVADSSPELVP